MALATRGDANLVTSADVDSQKSLVLALKEDTVNEKNKVSSLNQKISDLQLKIEKISDFKSSFPIETIKSNIEEKRSLEITISEKKHDIDKKKQGIKVLKKETEKLKDVPCSETCPVNRYISGATKALKKLTKQEEALNEIREDLNEIRKTYNKINKRDLEGDLEKYEDLLKKLNQYSREQNEFRVQHITSVSRLEKLKRDLKSQDSKLSEMMANVVEDDSAKELSELRQKLRDTKSNVSSTEIKYSQLSETIGLLQSNINKLVDEKSKFDELNQSWRVFELFTQATSKNGVPLQVIRSRLPDINAEIASILQGVTGFTVELESLEGSADMQVYINYGDSRRIIECCSGMEKMMSALAIRVALINVSNLPKPDMLIIDEGFGSLDSGNVEACNRFLETLKKWFRVILVISHVDAVKDGVDNVLEIRRSGVDAKIFHE